ncbi:DMT family transporter [Burkholderia anthina]|uniref:DMT family transporter n=1 Tax=Burkholderia anthina TaxID=179879 RepID=UPI0007587D4D|nr:DMT family transporter [Burkholderia anthina]KVN53108.1 hypothetical protein WT13_31985 [Burkholderia anthina]
MNIVMLAIAFLAGVAISVQAAVNSRLAEGIGGNTIAAALTSFFVGTVLLAVIGVAKGGLQSSLSALSSQPWWRFGGGFLGAAAIFSTVLLAPRIGLANLLALVIAGQLLASLIIDNYGLIGVVIREATAVRIVGATVMLLGVVLTLFGDRLIARIGVAS